MVGTLVCLVIIVTLLLVGSYAFLVKRKGKIKMKGRVTLCHILNVEFEFEHKDTL